MSLRAALFALLLLTVPGAALAQNVMKSADEGPDLSQLPMRGAQDGLVTILMFTDFQCPFCNRAQGTLKQVADAYPDDVRFVHANLPLSFHKDAHLAAQAALAAKSQGRFWEYHDLLFANQKELKPADLEKYAQMAQLNLVAFKAEVDQGTHKATVDDHIAAAGKLGLSGTPSFMINGVKFVGAQPFDAFKTKIDEELARAKKTQADTGLKGDALYYELFRTAPKEAPKPKAAAGGAPAQPTERVLVDVSNANLMLGTEGAPVTIVHYGGFQGPYDARSYKTMQELEAANPGTFALYFKHFPLDFHKRSRPAANAALAAAKRGLFKEYVALLWTDTKALELNNLVDYARQVGVNDIDAFEAEIVNEAYEQQIQADIAAGKADGVSGTPAFYMNGFKISGAQPLDRFQSYLDTELAAANTLLKDGVKKKKLYKKAVEDGKKRDAAGAKAAPGAVEKKKAAELAIKGRPFRGPKKAPVTILYFCDLQGPFCARVAPTIEEVLAAHPNDVKIVFKHLPLDFHVHAELAARSAWAAQQQDKFWDYSYLCNQNQKSLTPEMLEDFARQLGLDMDRFLTDRDSAKAKEIVQQDIADAKAVGITGTPSFMVGEEKFVGAQPLDAFKEVIRRNLK